MNYLGFDVTTNAANYIVKRLEKLKTTIGIESQGMYHQDRTWTMVHIDTTWTESQLDEWLYVTRFPIPVDYGTFTRKG